MAAFRFTSDLLKTIRNVRLYLPPDYAAGQDSLPGVYVLGGNEYLTLANMDHVLDYGLANGQFRPVVGVFVESVAGDSALAASGQLSRFLIEELVPYMEANYRVARLPAKRALMGASENGVTALSLAWANPQTFGIAAAQSATLDSEPGRAFIAAVSGARRVKPLAVYQDVGLFEGPALQANRELNEALTAGNYRHQYLEVPQGHSWGNWRGNIDEILKFSFPVAQP
jgi:enterochelin esterase family protein